MVAISSYDDLKAAASQFLHRDDVPTETFVQLAEAQFNRRLRAPEMRFQEFRTTAAGDTDIDMPGNAVLEWVSIVHGDEIGGEVDWGSPAEVMEVQRVATSARPRLWTPINGEIKLAPVPDAAYALDLNFWTVIPPLGDTTSTNWLLAKAPDLYLYTSLAMSEAFIGNDDRILVWKSLAEEALQEMVSASLAAAMAGGSLRASVRGLGV